MEESWQLPGIEPRAPGFISLRQQVLIEKSLWLTPNKILAADTEWLLNWVIQWHLCSTHENCWGLVVVWCHISVVKYWWVWSGALASKFPAIGFYLFASQHKSHYSNHTCITLGIIVLYSGIGETDTSLKVVSAQILYLPTGHGAINTVVSCSK